MTRRGCVAGTTICAANFGNVVAAGTRQVTGVAGRAAEGLAALIMADLLHNGQAKNQEEQREIFATSSGQCQISSDGRSLRTVFLRRLLLGQCNATECRDFLRLSRLVHGYRT
jgi:hypothetical protein